MGKKKASLQIHITCSKLPSCLTYSSISPLHLHPVELASAFPFLCYCPFAAAIVSLVAAHFLWSAVSVYCLCYAVLLTSSLHLWSLLDFFLPLDLAKIHTTLIFLFLFLLLVVSFWSHPPVLWDILVICGWRYSPSPLASEKCQSFLPTFLWLLLQGYPHRTGRNQD